MPDNYNTEHSKSWEGVRTGVRVRHLQRGVSCVRAAGARKRHPEKRKQDSPRGRVWEQGVESEWPAPAQGSGVKEGEEL